MSIKFVCSCGKHLRARDEMAARRSMCPRCGAPVGVPSLRPTHAGTLAAPLTPQERRRLRRDDAEDETESTSSTGSVVSLEDSAPPPTQATPETQRRKPKKRRRRLEQHWYQCLAYPFLNWSALLGLALILSVTMAGIILTVPNFPAFSVRSPSGWFPWFSSLLLGMLAVSYAYATVECALLSALAGEAPDFYLPGWIAGFPLSRGGRWLVCFFAGPIVPAGVASYYWFFGGDLAVLDWVILAELAMLTVAYWLLAIVSSNERNRLRDANLLRVAQLVHRLKYRAVVPLLIAPALGIAHARLGLFALTTLHEQMFAGWLLLVGCWCSGLFWAAFLFRLLGVWCYRLPDNSRPG